MPAGPRAFLKELQRRHVFRVGAAYLITAWVALQVGDLVLPAIGIDDATSILVAVAGAGLPVALVLAWVYELTGDGLRHEVSPGDDGAEADSPPERGRAPARRGAEPKRLIVLPFQILRPDPETDFLAFSLPDAVTCSLSGIRSLIVRSSMAAQRYSASSDLRAIGQDAEVDVVLSGTLLRAGAELEVRTQLTATADGTLLWSQGSRVQVEDLFALQEQLTRRIVDSLALPLSAREHDQMRRHAPASARAYELYLRANQLSLEVSKWAAARDLYLDCLRHDPEYAPAWARLARCHRLLGKYATDAATGQAEVERAEVAFRRALELDPDLPLTHSQYAHFEIDTGRAEEGLLRLLTRLEVNGPDAEILAGLVQACRFCGLLEQSLAAHRLARALDPQARTSVAHTHFMIGDYEAALGAYNSADIGYMEAVALAALGRAAEAVAALRAREATIPNDSLVLSYLSSLRLLLEGKREESLAAMERTLTLQRDGEGVYYLMRQLAFTGERRRALDSLQRVLTYGFFSYPTFLRDPWLDPLRGEPEFEALLERARLRHRQAVEAFRSAGGERLLGEAALVAGTTTPTASAVA